MVVASLSADTPSGHKEGDGDRLRGVHLLSHDPAFLGALPGTFAGASLAGAGGLGNVGFCVLGVWLFVLERCMAASHKSR